MRKIVVWVSVLAVLTLLTAGWTSTHSNTASSPRAGTSVLNMENNTGVTFTDNFNPFDGTSFVANMAVKTLTYEPLYEFDTLKAGVMHPWLATGYSFGSGGKSLTFTIRKGVHFSNGASLSAADVAYTFNLIKANPACNYSGIPTMSKDATVSGDKVTLYFTTPVYTDLPAIAGSTYIVPSSFGSSISGSPATAVVTDPIGTGPYVLSTYTAQAVTYTRNTHYWGGRPPIPEVRVLYESSNSTASEALAAGELDWAGNDIPSIGKSFVDRDKATNHYYFAPGSTVTLWFNTTLGALKNPLVREAISYAVNRDKLSKIGESGYEAPATSASGLILPNQSSYLLKQFKKDLPGKPDLKMTDSLLKKAGYKKVGHWWKKGGKKISFQIFDPTSYSDYYEDETLISSELQSAGIDATFAGVSTNTWYTDYPIGKFGAMVHWGSGGVSPFVQYQNWMDETLTAPIGKQAVADYGRFKSSKAEAALRKLEATNPSNKMAIDSAVDTLEKIFAADVPGAPLLYGADWDEYVTRYFTGFVTASNPYMDPSPNDPELPYILMHLKVK